MAIDKMKMQTRSGVADNINWIAEKFPNCITEKIDPVTGDVKLAVDFDMLRQELSPELVEGKDERYQFVWPDKKKAILLANAPVSATLRPCIEDSEDFENTQNLYIEGDNLDVLKCLKETYLGKVKMIYIDPPYNTGNDFVYKDNFAESIDEYLAKSGQYDEQGNRLVTNTESNGRFHTDWLNMMYPRLKVARDLLSKDGVIFISIDDYEITNTQKLCNEIFGESNCVGVFFWQSKKGGGSDNNTIVKDIEYVVCYAKNIAEENFFNKIKIEAEPLDQEDEKGKYRKGRELNKWGANSRREDRPTMFFPIIGPKGEDVYPIRNDGTEGCWRWGKQNMIDAVANNDVLFEPRGNGTYIVYEKIRNTDSRTKPYRSFLGDVETTADGSKLIKSIFDNLKVFDFPKPLSLILKIIEMGASKDSIILDFFSGSSTTAQAVLQSNARDNGSRKFIMVQLPEIFSNDSEAHKAGYKTICDVGKERIRRASLKIKKESGSDIDYGFRVLKLDSTNMENVYYSPSEVNQSEVDMFANNVKPGRTSEDLLFQTMLELGATLDSKIVTSEINGKKIYDVADRYLVACFDTEVTDTVIKAIAMMQPQYAVLRDSSLADDSTATNFEQIFKTYSPATTCKIL